MKNFKVILYTITLIISIILVVKIISYKVPHEYNIEQIKVIVSSCVEEKGGYGIVYFYYTSNNEEHSVVIIEESPIKVGTTFNAYTDLNNVKDNFYLTNPKNNFNIIIKTLAIFGIIFFNCTLINRERKKYD